MEPTEGSGTRRVSLRLDVLPCEVSSGSPRERSQQAIGKRELVPSGVWGQFGGADMELERCSRFAQSGKLSRQFDERGEAFDRERFMTAS